MLHIKTVIPVSECSEFEIPKSTYYDGRGNMSWRVRMD